jgi:hypothetical protein
MKNLNQLGNLPLAMMQGNLVYQPRANPEQDTEKTKRIAIQCLLLASKCMSEQKYKQAKDLLLVAMSRCLSVE